MKAALIAFLFVRILGECVAASAVEVPPNVDPARYRISLRATVEAYDQVGNRDARWDAQARAALLKYASLVALTNGAWAPVGAEVQLQARGAIDKGCPDPFIRYLGIRYDTARSGLAAARTNLMVAEAFHQSRYPALRRFTSLMWCRRTLKDHPELKADLQRIEGLAAGDLAVALEDRSIPQPDLADALDTLLNSSGMSNEVIWNLYRAVEDPLEKNWMDTAAGLLAKGRAYINGAWVARGIGLANTVTPEGWKQMAGRLAVAERALEAAWALDPKNSDVCYQMMSVELGQGKGRDRMEMWFDRGMNLIPSGYGFCSSKLYYLYPRWYGSEEEMLKFGRLCLTNTAWSGRVPVILVDAHDEVARMQATPQLRAEYWWKPEVWKDVEAAFEACLKKQPDDTDLRHRYAKYAMKGGKPLVFVEQVRQFKWTNALYFGKPGEFEETLQSALEIEQRSKKEKR